MYPEINRKHPAFNLTPAQKHRLFPQKPKIVWYNPDETHRIGYHDLIWIKYDVGDGNERVALATSAFIDWDENKNCFRSFENSPYIRYVGFAICPPGTKEGEMYVE